MQTAFFSPSRQETLLSAFPYIFFRTLQIDSRIQSAQWLQVRFCETFV